MDKTVIEFIEMPLETKQGFMEFSGIQNGLWHSEHWRVVHITKDYIIGVQLTNISEPEPMIRIYLYTKSYFQLSIVGA